MKIPLPNVTVRHDAKAHPYPFQLAFQTLEFIQAVMFHTIIGDISSGEFMKQDGSINTLRAICEQNNISEEAWEHGWICLEKFKAVFENTSFHNTLIGFNSHWDWYVRNLGKFVLFARDYVKSPELNRQDTSDFKRIGANSILRQIELLQKASGVQLMFAVADIAKLKEMTMVRNLTLHNRCEVDEMYLVNSNCKNYKYGDLRLVDIKEIGLWRKSLTKVIRTMSREIAITYREVPIRDIY